MSAYDLCSSSLRVMTVRMLALLSAWCTSGHILRCPGQLSRLLKGLATYFLFAHNRPRSHNNRPCFQAANVTFSRHEALFFNRDSFSAECLISNGWFQGQYTNYKLDDRSAVYRRNLQNSDWVICVFTSAFSTSWLIWCSSAYYNRWRSVIDTLSAVHLLLERGGKIKSRTPLVYRQPAAFPTPLYKCLWRFQPYVTWDAACIIMVSVWHILVYNRFFFKGWKVRLS